MKRGITEQQIREAIEHVLAEGQEPTTTSVRAILGTGSFTTIGAVLAKWRNEEALNSQDPVPQIPKSATQLLHRLWAEAWRSAQGRHETERAGFRAERQDWNSEKNELEAEIAQLESLGAEQLVALEERDVALNEHRVLLRTSEQSIAVANARIESLETESVRLLDERRQFTIQLANLSERAAAAETRLRQPST